MSHVDRRRWNAVTSWLLTALCLTGAVTAADFEDLVDPGARVRKVAGGCQFTEGPAWSPEGYLVFSDIPANRIIRLMDDGSLEDFLKPSEMANGLMFDRGGRLFACQVGARRVVRIDVRDDRKITVLADRYEDKKLNSPNDLAVDAVGGVYFTDPASRRVGPPEQPVMGVYYADSAGKVRRVVEDLERPNGILVSPDGRHLYVAEPRRSEIYRFDIVSPGKLGGKKLFFTGDPDRDGRGPDGMAHDVHGNIYATYSGIVVLDRAGEVLGRVAVPERPSNCTFGGKDRRTLYITARTSLYAIDTKVTGMALQPGPGGATREVKTGALTLKVPASWKKQSVTSRMRLAQFEIPAVKGDPEAGELIVYYFGPGGAGGAEANIQRWIGQFASSPEPKVVRQEGASSQGKFVMVDVTGTYNKPIGPPIRRQSKPMPGARMLAAILGAESGAHYLKLTGPAKTVTAAREDFLRSFGAR